MPSPHVQRRKPFVCWVPLAGLWCTYVHKNNLYRTTHPMPTQVHVKGVSREVGLETGCMSASVSLWVHQGSHFCQKNYLKGENLVKDWFIGSPCHLSSEVLRQLLEQLKVMLHQVLSYPHLQNRGSYSLSQSATLHRCVKQQSFAEHPGVLKSTAVYDKAGNAEAYIQMHSCWAARLGLPQPMPHEYLPATCVTPRKVTYWSQQLSYRGIVTCHALLCCAVLSQLDIPTNYLNLLAGSKHTQQQDVSTQQLQCPA